MVEGFCFPGQHKLQEQAHLQTSVNVVFAVIEKEICH